MIKNVDVVQSAIHQFEKGIQYMTGRLWFTANTDENKMDETVVRKPVTLDFLSHKP